MEYRPLHRVLILRSWYKQMTIGKKCDPSVFTRSETVIWKRKSHTRRRILFCSSYQQNEKAASELLVPSPLKSTVRDTLRRNGGEMLGVLKRVHDDVTKWKHFPRHWPFVRGIHRSPVNSLYKGQWREALMLAGVWLGRLWITLVVWQSSGWLPW